MREYVPMALPCMFTAIYATSVMQMNDNAQNVTHFKIVIYIANFSFNLKVNEAIEPACSHIE